MMEMKERLMKKTNNEIKDKKDKILDLKSKQEILFLRSSISSSFIDFSQINEMNILQAKNVQIHFWFCRN